MLRKLVVGVMIVALAAAGGLWFGAAPASVPAEALGPHEPDIENGRRMFFAGNCGACHSTPDQKDDLVLGGGHATRTQFGTFHAPNISPHPDAGIGGWTEAQFVTAMTKGTSPDARHYYPVFPYPSFQRMAQTDVRDLFAFLKTLSPVESQSRPHEVAFPYNVRRGIGLWKRLYLDGEPFTPDPNQSAEWNRGAYLVNGPAHCAECHSPRDALGGIVGGQRFAGGPSADGKGWVPNITQWGLSHWEVDDIASFLETGETPDYNVVGGDMSRVIANTARLSEEDRRAMAVYLKSLPEVEGPERPEGT